MHRTLEELKKMHQKAKGENYCCVHPPLLNIPLDHIILDELHLMLRISDILINNIVEDAMEWDDKDAFTQKKRKSGLSSKLLSQSYVAAGCPFQCGKNKMQMGKAVVLGTGPA